LYRLAVQQEPEIVSSEQARALIAAL